MAPAVPYGGRKLTLAIVFVSMRCSPEGPGGGVHRGRRDEMVEKLLEPIERMQALGQPADMVAGAAVAKQPSYDVRITNGRVEVRSKNPGELHT